MRDDPEIPVESQDIPLFSEVELISADTSMKNGNAPDLDCVPAEALKAVAYCCLDLLQWMFNACFRAEILPLCWKIARLVVLPKGKGFSDSLSHMYVKQSR